MAGINIVFFSLFFDHLARSFASRYNLTVISGTELVEETRAEVMGELEVIASAKAEAKVGTAIHCIHEIIQMALFSLVCHSKFTTFSGSRLRLQRRRKLPKKQLWLKRKKNANSRKRLGAKGKRRKRFVVAGFGRRKIISSKAYF